MKKEPQSENTVETQNNSTPRSLHTPGPWFVNRYRAAIQTADPSKPTISNRPICYLETENRAMPKTTDADARLIATAPELLEACKELREVVAACFRVISDAGEQAVDKLEMALAALGIAKGFGVRAQEVIAKAEGASSSVPDASESATASSKQ